MKFAWIEDGAAANALLDLARVNLKPFDSETWESRDQRLLNAVQAIERARELFKSANDQRLNDGAQGSTAAGSKLFAQKDRRSA